MGFGKKHEFIYYNNDSLMGEIKPQPRVLEENDTLRHS